MSDTKDNPWERKFDRNLIQELAEKILEVQESNPQMNLIESKDSELPQHIVIELGNLEKVTNLTQRNVRRPVRNWRQTRTKTDFTEE